MPVLGVVPADEGMNPGTRLLDGCEATGGPGRDVLAGPEERLGEGIVVRHPRPAEGRNDAETLHGGFHGRALHRAAVVGMQRKRAGEAPLRPDRALEKQGGQFGAFTRVNLPADNLPAEDVLDEVEVIEQPKHWSGKPSDVPRPDLAGALCLEGRRRLRSRGCPDASTPVVLSPLPQHPVEARFRSDIGAAISQPGHDLAGRKAGKFRRIARRDDLVPLILAQAVRRDLVRLGLALARRSGCPLTGGPA